VKTVKLGLKRNLERQDSEEIRQKILSISSLSGRMWDSPKEHCIT
jgi:hypothetical protein